jgi:hypothetical protein
MMEFFGSCRPLWRAHWPMQGPQALASTTPPILEGLRAAVALGGVAHQFASPALPKFSLFAFRFLSTACRAMDRRAVRSS